MSKQLYRSRTNRKIAGVCGVLGEYMNLDPTVVRLIWVLLFFFAGVGILAYLIAALIIPENPNGY